MKHLILIGYRGSGKTSVGKAAAVQLGCNFVDVDDETCNAFGIDSIAEIWEKFGEPKWREEEVKATQRLCNMPAQVIGLGGGTLMQPGAREAVEQADAMRIYLKADPEELYKRITGDARSSATRPNLTGKGGGLDEINEMLEKRGPTYEAVADHVIDVTMLSIEQAVEKTLQLING